jgi:DNA-binding XRE family transcriptional regulator
MTGDDLRMLRDKKHLYLSQAELARALNVSFATVNRWETGRTPIPIETSRLLECFQDVLHSAKKRKAGFDIKDLREAALTTGVAGVVAGAASARLIAPALLGALALTAPFAWVGGIAGIGAAAALTFFNKVKAKKGNQHSEERSKR